MTLIARPLHRTVWLIVLGALVLAQTLGALHRVVHSPLASRAAIAQAAGSRLGGPAHASPVSASHAAAKAAPAMSGEPRSGRGWLVLFSGHASEQGCDLFDQLSHADFLLAWAPAPPPAFVAPQPVARMPLDAVAAIRTAFRARAPPRFG
jgi:hypothetical protein